MASRGLAEVRYKTVAELFDAFLGWVEKYRSEGTYYNSKHYLTLFAQHLGKSFTIARLQSIHVTQWIESREDWTSSTGNDAVSIVQRAFNGAVKRGHLLSSPVAVVEGKPRRAKRETVFNEAQWKELRGHVKDQQFGDFLDFMWLTGCRPKEAREIESHHVDLENSMIVFPPSEAKGERHERVIFLSDQAVEIVERNMRDDGPIFRNTKGRPWTKDSINCRFQRLQKKLDFPACAYGIRHSFATEGLKKGMDSMTLAQLMGHADTSMLSRHYAHLSRNPMGFVRCPRELDVGILLGSQFICVNIGILELTTLSRRHRASVSAPQFRRLLVDAFAKCKSEVGDILDLVELFIGSAIDNFFRMARRAPTPDEVNAMLLAILSTTQFPVSDSRIRKAMVCGLDSADGES